MEVIDTRMETLLASSCLASRLAGRSSSRLTPPGLLRALFYMPASTLSTPYSRLHFTFLSCLFHVDC